MALLTLEKLGKIYVSEGAVSVGIRGVDLSFDAGEFVAVTGKSGSGKTTLLNAISGMDSYEEGELYIEGTPTSHYTQEDWEAYREKYISFIFQDYNIIESFTVLQNVEQSLTYIRSRHERRRRALALIDRVGMTPYRNHRGSKLSGGQKQRTVIARALAKDSPIILADEPTGNLDSRSAKEVIALLREVSRDKLVIVVTHNFEQLADCATREIRVFDGQIERDTRMMPTEAVTPRMTEVPKKTKRDTLRRGFLLGWHRFCATPRLTTFICFVMLLAMLGTFALTSVLIAGTESDTTDALFGYAPGRLIVTRHDGAAISDEEVEMLARITGAQDALHYDALLDDTETMRETVASGKTNLYAPYRFCYNLADITGGDPSFSPDAGRMPTADGEALLYLPISWEQVYGRGTLLKEEVSLRNGACTLRVAGVKYYYDNRRDAKIYMTPDALRLFSGDMLLNDRKQGGYRVVAMPQEGTAVAFNTFYCDRIVLDRDLSAATFALGFYNRDQLADITDGAYRFNIVGDSNASPIACDIDAERTVAYSEAAASGWLNTLYVSEDVFDTLIQRAIGDYTQASLFFRDDAEASRVARSLIELTGGITDGLTDAERAILDDGYFAATSDAVHASSSLVMETLLLTVFKYLAWFLLILFLGLFLTLCYARGMNATRGDLGILRSMGISASVIRVASYAQVCYSMLPAIILTGVAAVVIYRIPVTNAIFPYLGVWHYCLIFLGAVLLALRVARRYNHKIFSQSVRKTLRGGAENG